MPLPEQSGHPWPPPQWQPAAADMAEADAWYTGDPSKLAGQYGGVASNTHNTRTGFAKFWSRAGGGDTTPRTPRLHAPAAADIAQAAADLLFGEPVVWTVTAYEGDTEAAVQTDRINELVDTLNLDVTLIEAAEVASGLGGVYLRPTWDPQAADTPLLTVVHADSAVPEFRWGRLAAVTFWSQVHSEQGKVWRWLERHETVAGQGWVHHGLYVGTVKELGKQVPLDAHPATEGLAGNIIRQPTGIRLAPAYVPNQLPNRRHRKDPQLGRCGRSDTAGAEDLMDAYDELFTSWMRDFRLGKARIIVPNEFLEKQGRGKGAAFDVDAEVFSPLEMDPTVQDRAGIQLIQPTLRVGDHQVSMGELFEMIVRHAGYSPQSFGLQGDGAQITATEVDAKGDRTDATLGKKWRYFRPALRETMWNLLCIDREIFGSQVLPVLPDVERPAGAEQNMRDTASMLNLLNLADAASTETKVRMLHPDWDTSQVEREVEAIRSESETIVDDPTGGLPA